MIHAGAARNQQLKRDVAATRAPLRGNATFVVRLANQKGLAGGLAVVVDGG